MKQNVVLLDGPWRREAAGRALGRQDLGPLFALLVERIQHGEKLLSFSGIRVDFL